MRQSKRRVGNFSRNNEKKGLGKNLKMNDDTYALRRKVMDVIYSAKSLIKDLPRVEVRITDKPTKSDHSGIAYLNQRVIFIP